MEIKKLILAPAMVVVLTLCSQTSNAQAPPQQPAATSQAPERLPLFSSDPANYAYTPAPLSYRQQQAQYVEFQRTMRMEFNRNIGYSPLRPNMNASYMSNGLQKYYIPQRGVFISTGSGHSSWFW